MTTKTRMSIRRCRRCTSWLGVMAANRHECRPPNDPIIDSILSEYAREVVA